MWVIPTIAVKIMVREPLLTPRGCLKEEVGVRGVRLVTARWSTRWKAGSREDVR